MRYYLLGAARGLTIVLAVFLGLAFPPLGLYLLWRAWKNHKNNPGGAVRPRDVGASEFVRQHQEEA